ncbi:16S rRNA (cytidine(1402)-2'-O)-methyltransferase [candidate division WOR-3 bacterium]|nr:16S rRNA (cytidine(1402)-2'-O)-methyltransferase [candidate division WOR-3 bacterium]
MKSGSLYVVSTPIGNLEDITFRAVRILSEVDIIACEDTRRTFLLMQKYGIKNKTISYNENNKNFRTPKLISLMRNSLSVALVSDAGTPVVSDPGQTLIKKCIENAISVVPVPGPSSAVCAVSVSGFRAEEFLFLGFLPKKKSKRTKKLIQAFDAGIPAVLFESPQRLARTLSEISEHEPKRCLSVAREMTKINEEFRFGSAEKLAQEFLGKTVKGEIVVVIGGKET